MDKWNNLSMYDRNEFIKVAVRNGIIHPQEIRDKYNEFADGGIINKNNLRDSALKRSTYVASNYDEAKDFNMNPLIYKVRKWAKDNFDKGGLSNCTLSATQWVDPNNPYMAARNIINNSSSGYTEITPEEAIPGDLLIAKNPEHGSYHTMLIQDYDKNGSPLLTYSRGGHNTRTNLVKEIPLELYHNADNAQGGNHTEDHYFRYNYPDEHWLPEVIITAPKRKANGGGLDFLDKPFSYSPIPKVRY